MPTLGWRRKWYNLQHTAWKPDQGQLPKTQKQCIRVSLPSYICVNTAVNNAELIFKQLSGTNMTVINLIDKELFTL